MNKIKNIYKNLSLPAKASLWYMLCSVLQKGISVITTPIFTRILSTEQYGLVSIYSSWESIITVFATLNFTAGVYNNAMVKYEDDRDGYTSVMQTWTTIITLTLFAVYTLTRTFWNGVLELSTPLLIMMFIDIVFTAAMSFWSIRNRYEYKYLPVCVVTTLTTVLVPIVSVIMVYSTEKYKAEARIFGMVIVHAIIYGFVYIVNLWNGKKLFKKEYVVYSTKFNLPLIPHYLSQNILNQADRIMINNMCSVAKAGIYSVAYNAGFMINIITLSINSSFVPYLYESMKKKKYKEIGKIALEIEIIVGLICFGFSLFAPEVIAILATDEYREAIWIIPPVAMSAMLNMMYSFFTNIEFYFEKNKFILASSVITALLNIAMNYVCIIFFGYIAAGYTTLACWIIYSGSQYLFMKKVCKENNVPNPYNGKAVWGIAGIFILLAILSEALFLTRLIRYIVIAIAFLVTAALLLKNKEKISELIKK